MEDDEKDVEKECVVMVEDLEKLAKEMMVAEEKSVEAEDVEACCICFGSEACTRLHPRGSDACGAWCCEECLVTYIKTSVDSDTVRSDGLKCPNYDCGAYLPESKLAGVGSLSQDVLDKYRVRVADKAALLAARDARLRQFFPSFSDVVADVQFSRWQHGRETRRCPGCRSLIEKNGGCQHMTCQKCHHEFHWCCRQAYHSGHNPALCILGSTYHQHSPWWGPIAPVRAVTKTVALAAGVPIACVAIPTYLLYEKIGQHFSPQNIVRRRRAREQRRLAARMAVLAQQRDEQKRWLQDRELSSIHAVLAHWWGAPEAPPFAIYDKQMVVEIQRASRLMNGTKPHCGICKAEFLQPIDFLLHLHAMHHGDWDDPGHRAQMHHAILELFPGPHGCDPLLTHQFSPPLPEASEMRVDSMAPAPTFPISVHQIPAVHNFREKYGSQIAQWQEELTAVQTCSCGATFESLTTLTEHIVANSSHISELVTSTNSGRCLVATSPGRLCSCTACQVQDGEDLLCSSCSHPAFLHQSTRPSQVPDIEEDPEDGTAAAASASGDFVFLKQDE
mmetsp:Transcript_19961/g.58306  ORF Transcript_19961/g.58306 Transcript_19961/m.58306 type:complete len:561 (-) Transcript_19961:26-1708(-)